MTGYLEYTKGGYVLLAPSLDYKHPYILKCFMCDDYYGEFELFLSHCQSHNDEIDPKSYLNGSESLEELCSGEEKVYINGMEEDGRENEEQHNIFDIDMEDMFDLKNEEIKEEDTFEDGETFLYIVDNEQHDETNEKKAYNSEVKRRSLNEIDEDNQSIVSMDASNYSLYDPKSEADYSDDHVIHAEDDDEETSATVSKAAGKDKNIKSKRGKTQNFEKANEEVKPAKCKVRSVSARVKRFMDSHPNIMALIQAYQRQPLLWNLNYMEHLRTKERVNCMQKIAAALKRELNISLTHLEVSKLILMLRIKYRGHLMRDTALNNLSEDLLRRLDFLKPFMENNYLAVLFDDRPYLDNKQISQILKIYQTFPILWNPDLIEHWCKNKRLDEIKKMAKTVNLKMNLKVTCTILENYLFGVHLFLTKQKRRSLGIGEEKEEQLPAYYDDLMFLYEHVYPFKCSFCKKLLKNPLYFKIHMGTHDDKAVGLKCNLCEKQYKSADHYIDHAKRHMEDLELECEICGKKFLRRSALESHMRIHTGERAYVCETCGASYRYSSSLVIHKRKHTKEYIYPCNLCPKKFISSTGLATHMIVHKPDRNYVCPICDKAFKSKDILRHHSWTHADGSHPCEVCGKIFKHPYKVYVHMKTHRTKKNEKNKR